MNTKTMEGLVGARTNMNLMDTPMRVYKEARRKGDTVAMERAMGYASEFSDKAQEYKAEADKGMEEDAKEAREKEKSEREEAVRKRREERKKLEEKITERNADHSTDTKETQDCLLETKDCLLETQDGLLETKDGLLETKDCLLETRTCLLEISGEGKALLKDNTGLDSTVSDKIRTDVVKEPVTYTKTGKTVSTEQNTSISISV